MTWNEHSSSFSLWWTFPSPRLIATVLRHAQTAVAVDVGTSKKYPGNPRSSWIATSCSRSHRQACFSIWLMPFGFTLQLAQDLCANGLEPIVHESQAFLRLLGTSTYFPVKKDCVCQHLWNCPSAARRLVLLDQASSTLISPWKQWKHWFPFASTQCAFNILQTIVWQVKHRYGLGPAHRLYQKKRRSQPRRVLWCHVQEGSPETLSICA